MSHFCFFAAAIMASHGASATTCSVVHATFAAAAFFAAALRTTSAPRAVSAAYSAFDILPWRALEPSNSGSGVKTGVAYRTAILAFSAFASASAWVTALSDSLDPSVGTSRLVYIETSVSGWCRECYSGSRNRCGPGVNPQLVHWSLTKYVE